MIVNKQRKKNSIIVQLVVLTMLVSLIAACGGNGNNGGKTNTATNATEQPGNSSTVEPGAGSSSGKITDKPITLKWYQVNYAGAELTNMGESAGFKEIERRTGVKIEWQHPPSDDQINLMLASGEYPDVIFWNFGSVNRGLKGLIDDGVAIKLNDLIEQHAPNYKAQLDKYPEIKKMAIMNDGTMPAFYQLDPDPKRLAYSGHYLRKDWLDKLNLTPPTTIDEWYTVLKSFKDGDPNGNGQPDEIPYSIAKVNGGVLGGGTSGITEFAAAWGVLDGFYHHPDTNTLAYGPIEPAFKDFLTTMNQWYAEGLIDSEYASTDGKSRDTKIQGNLLGSTYGFIGSGIGNNTSAARPNNPDFTLLGVTPPVGPAGKPYNYTNDLVQKVGLQGIITKSNPYPVETVKFLDYLYSEEGQEILNWGIEGESYTKVDGKKQFTDNILNNPDGKSPSQAIAHYAFPINGFTKTMEFEPYSQINLVLPEQKQSAENWAKGDTTLNTPVSLEFSSSDSATLTPMMADINTYKTEMILKFIMGVEPIDKFDDFVKRLKQMGIEEALSLYQAAYNDFNARK
ncbi:extracellular solute-binding protein [Paenibacillus yanchengensis]|uniref:Extracellular solute-binding protein n=1 Tax=Paenibacillus yanchengensis TaxID=2035833 RepID=A0ABW4YM37_9BACL